MELPGPCCHGNVIFKSGLTADIVSISMSLGCFILTAIASGPAEMVKDSEYTVFDACGDRVVHIKPKKGAAPSIPSLEKGESVIITLEVKM